MLEKADLSHNELAGRVPAEVGSLRELVFLDLSHNELAGPLPASMAGLGKLQYLLLQENPIGTAVPAAVVGSLRRLQVVGMSGCGLTGPIPRGAFAALASLAALSLDRNRLDGPIPASLAALPRLGRLNLSQNRLAGEIALPAEFVARLGSASTCGATTSCASAGEGTAARRRATWARRRALRLAVARGQP